MNNDRELLELAAKAVGYFDYPNDSLEMGSVWHTDKSKAPFDKCFPKSSWNPLTDDGDALRLAVKLRLNIDFIDCCAWSCGIFGLIQEFWGGDYDPCYRRAIVRAAAEIGRNMK